MKIKKITVNNLFGLFHHEISLNLEEHITIIHGPNGIGKTVLLTILNSIFSSKYHELRRIPFNDLLIDFDDNSNLLLKKEIQHKTEMQLNLDGKEIIHDENILIFELRKDSKLESHTIKSMNYSKNQLPIRMIADEIPGLTQISDEDWIYFPTQEKLSLEEVIDRFSNELSIRFPKRQTEPEWFKKLKNSINIRFIETQRLLNFSYSRRLREYKKQSSMVPAVINYSEELAIAIQEKLAEYGSLSQSLDRTFPTRLVRGSHESEPTMDELKNSLNELEEKRSSLMAAGLLDREKEIDFKELQKIDESNRNVLTVYIEDVKKKLSVFKELNDKIDLLIKIINRRFLYKQMSISKKEGFTFKTSDGKNLSAISLSSGEQHELVLLYELLFKVGPNSLILIDEPELSLHVVWQQQFLKDLQEITNLAGFDVLIATHSPQIIHDRWDLTIELQGPENNEK
ncbi:MAG: AAA family ATPase [Methanosarcinales archaeon]|nr:AAA family ATPase [Methanosarcinales archaeon]